MSLTVTGHFALMHDPHVPVASYSPLAFERDLTSSLRHLPVSIHRSSSFNLGQTRPFAQYRSMDVLKMSTVSEFEHAFAGGVDEGEPVLFPQFHIHHG